jgi:hypothetical protein
LNILGHWYNIQKKGGRCSALFYEYEKKLI